MGSGHQHDVGWIDGLARSQSCPDGWWVLRFTRPRQDGRWGAAHDSSLRLHLFVRTQAQMREKFPVLVPHLAPQAKLWLSWPKARKIGYDFGLVESSCLRVDDTWTGLRFTHPKEGKVYANSFGTLPSQRS